MIILLPFFWMVSVSLKPRNEPFAIPARLWPEHPTLDNYITAFRPEFRIYFINSIIVSLSTVVITVTLACLPPIPSPAPDTADPDLHGLVVAAQMFPASAIIIPIYKMMKAANLLNTYASLILAYITMTLPVAIWMLRAFMARIPIELDEAAAVDGAGPFRTFFSVILPLCRPGIIATAVFMLIVTWQEFLFALSFTSTKVDAHPAGRHERLHRPIRHPLWRADGELGADLRAGRRVFFLLQRQFVAGLTAGAVKG